MSTIIDRFNDMEKIKTIPYVPISHPFIEGDPVHGEFLICPKIEFKVNLKTRKKRGSTFGWPIFEDFPHS
jgi:hypothetical protein